MSSEHGVVNPATGLGFATVLVPDPDGVDAAVAAATHAYEDWRATALETRIDALDRIADAVTARTDELARLLTLEQGKPTDEALTEVSLTIAAFRRDADLGRRLGDALFVEEADDHRRTYGPLGVVAGIIPWNFPLYIAAMKTAPALLAGNAIVLKPAPTTPLATIELGRLIAEIVPAGLVQVLADDGSVGPILVAHPGVRKIAFTGSTVTGRNVMAAGAPMLKRITLELGGNDPAIVLADADPEAVADGIFGSVFYNAGQVCGAIKRLYVHDDVYDGLVAALASRVSTAVVGNGSEPGVTIGPMQNRTQYEKAARLLDSARRDGEILAQSAAPMGEGYFLPATLVGGLDESHPLVQQEQFAPVLPILRFSDEEDVIARANATEYGLTASVWTSDVARGEAVVERIDAGLLCVNKHNDLDPALGVAMSKQSGAGWLFGLESVRGYQQPHLLYR